MTLNNNVQNPFLLIFNQVELILATIRGVIAGGEGDLPEDKGPLWTMMVQKGSVCLTQQPDSNKIIGQAGPHLGEQGKAATKDKPHLPATIRSKPRPPIEKGAQLHVPFPGPTIHCGGPGAVALMCMFLCKTVCFVRVKKDVSDSSLSLIFQVTPFVDSLRLPQHHIEKHLFRESHPSFTSIA